MSALENGRSEKKPKNMKPTCMFYQILSSQLGLML